jgi:hypothetical protein
LSGQQVTDFDIMGPEHPLTDPKRTLNGLKGTVRVAGVDKNRRQGDEYMHGVGVVAPAVPL